MTCFWVQEVQNQEQWQFLGYLRLVGVIDHFDPPDVTAAHHAFELPNDQITCDLCLEHGMSQDKLKVASVHPSCSVKQPVVAACLAEDAMVSRDLPYSK